MQLEQVIKLEKAYEDLPQISIVIMKVKAERKKRIEYLD